MRMVVAVSIAIAVKAHADKAENDAAIGDTVVTGLPMTAELASTLPPQGMYIAGLTRHSTNQVDEDFYIARLDAKGLRSIHREHEAGIQSRAGHGLAWVDARTLVTNDFVGNTVDAAALTIYRMNGDDAPKVERIVIKAEEWRLGRIKVEDWFTELLLTKRGEVWLQQCLHKSKRTFECKHERFLRVFGGERTIAARQPKGVIASSRAMPLPNARAPAGYRVKLHAARRPSRQGGFTCTGPSGTHVSPDDDIERDPAFPVRPDRVRWIMTKPPIYEVTGDMDTPVATVVRSQEFYRACDPHLLRDFAVIRPRLWAETIWSEHTQGPKLSHTETKLYIDEHSIGTVAGGSNDVAFSP
jgi:hypothetical protein